MDPIPIENVKEINQSASSVSRFSSQVRSAFPSNCVPTQDLIQRPCYSFDLGNLQGFQFQSKALRNLYEFGEGQRRYPVGIVKRFLKAMQMIASAKSGQDLYSFRSFRFHKLKGAEEYSLWLTANWRLISRFVETENGCFLQILRIEDYH